MIVEVVAVKVPTPEDERSKGAVEEIIVPAEQISAKDHHAALVVFGAKHNKAILEACPRLKIHTCVKYS